MKIRYAKLLINAHIKNNATEPGHSIPARLIVHPACGLRSVCASTHPNQILCCLSEESLDVGLPTERKTMTLISLRICAG